MVFTFGSLYDDVVMASIMQTFEWPCQLWGYMSLIGVGSLLLMTRRSVKVVSCTGAFFEEICEDDSFSLSYTAYR
jgi:hypothetical protein